REVSGVVLEGAFSSYKDIAARKLPVLGSLFTKEEYSAVKSVQVINTPLLIIHSIEDNLVPYKMGQKIFNYAKSKRKKFLTIKGCHICGPQIYADTISKEIRHLVD